MWLDDDVYLSTTPACAPLRDSKGCIDPRGRIATAWEQVVLKPRQPVNPIYIYSDSYTQNPESKTALSLGISD